MLYIVVLSLGFGLILLLAALMAAIGDAIQRGPQIARKNEPRFNEASR